MKMSKEELIKKVNESEIDDELKISLMEDITDSFEGDVQDNSELEEVKAKYEELKEKYKARFLEGEEKEPEKEDDEEIKEEEVIDVKEI
mgnify:CR=1 FL=1